MKRKLKDFVAEKKKLTECFLCTIPEREEIEEAKRAGAQTKHIVEWLINDCEYMPEIVLSKRPQMGHHFATHMRKVADGD